MARKAQTTFYIILAVIVALVVGVYIMITSADTIDDDSIIEFEGAISLKTFTENCIKETTYTGLMKMGLQGGYVDLPDKYVSTVFSDVPYYYHHGEDLSPTISVMERELAGYVTDNIDDCIYNYNAFRNKGYVVETGSRSTQVSINDKDVLVEFYYPVTILKGPDRYDFERFFFKADVRLKDIYEISQSILTKVFIDSQNIDQTHLLSKMQEYELQIDTLTSTGGIVNYVIDDPKSILWPGTQLMFMFATKTDMTERKPVINTKQKDYYVEVGDLLEIEIDVSDPNNDRLEYSSNSSFIYPNPYSGMIEFIPSDEDVGVHSVEIYVMDGTFTITYNIRIFVGEAE